MRRLVHEIRERTGLGASIGIGPNRLVAKVASDAEKPARVRRPDARAGMRALRGRTARRSCRESARGPRSASRRSGIATLGELAALRRAAARRARSAQRQGPWLRGRARFEGSSEIEPVREAVSESRETTFDFDIADPARLEQILGRAHRAALRRACGATSGAGRTIAIKVRLDDWTTVTRARTIAASDERRARGGGGRARRCCASTRRRGRCGCSACASPRSPRRARRGGRRADGAAALSCARRPRRKVAVMASDGAARRLHHETRGDGEPLLLIQGLSGTHLAWGEPFLSALGDGLQRDRLRPPRHRAVVAARRLVHDRRPRRRRGRPARRARPRAART